jgi:hypothetical protein
MKTLKALYWDTDSVFVRGLPEDEIQAILAVNMKLYPNRDWLPANAVPVIIGEELGELDMEMRNGHGYLAGTKRYYLTDPLYDREEYDEEGKRLGTVKKAIHGIPALDYKNVPEVIKALATGNDYSYDSKGRPLKAKESKTPEDVGSFRSSHYKSQFHLDDRLYWKETADGWVGSVRPFDEIGIKELSDEQYNHYMERLYKDELSYDQIKEWVKQEGYLKTILPGEQYYSEYKEMSRSTKAKYFRKNGIPVDVFATNCGMEVQHLIEELRTK